jgi:predicted nucleic acid-binding protein
VSEARPRVFFDTNVIFSAIYSRSGPPGRLLRGEAIWLQPVISDRVLDELTRNLARKAPHHLASLQKLVTGVAFEVVAHPPSSEVEPWLRAGLNQDAAIVAAALSAEVDFLCTGDRGIHARASLCAEAGLKLIRPADLLQLLRRL